MAAVEDLQPPLDRCQPVVGAANQDLVPVIHLDSASMVLLAHAAFPPKTMAEALAQIRANPGAVSCGGVQNTVSRMV